MNRLAIQVVLTHHDQETLLRDVLALVKDYKPQTGSLIGPKWINKSAVVDLFFSGGDDEEYERLENDLVYRLSLDESVATVTALVLEVSS